jgi:hypothetical protein
MVKTIVSILTTIKEVKKMSKFLMRDKQVYGILNVVKKMPLSKMGNPKYRVEINGDIFETVNNAMLGYAITNYDNKNVVAQVRYLKTKNVIHNVIFRNTLDNDFSHQIIIEE